VHDRETAVCFVRWCVEVIGLGYHPDTLFSEYVDGDGQATFSAPEVARLEDLAERAFDHCDPYEVGNDEFQRILNTDGGDPQTI